MKTLFFYDLETSGLNPREDRIMQFAGQRTDLDFKPIGEPIDILVKLNDDTLPSPEAILVTGITPQKTVEDGYTEAEFAKILTEEVFTEDTVVIGFNNIRFDDEFIRYLFWRNFYDPYEWAWKNGRSRWDILDLVRMTRALRPDGIEWPVDDKGEPTNRLELITKANGILHENAHDAMSDVNALISVAKLIKQEQPNLYDYLFSMREKGKIKDLVNLEDKQPFVYSSGRYDKEHAKTTVAFPVSSAPHNNVLVYDLRYDPEPFLAMSEAEISSSIHATWEERQVKDFIKLPVKQLQYNRCPAVAPLGVLEQSDGWERINLDKETVKKHLAKLLDDSSFAEKLRLAYEKVKEYPAGDDPEAKLYDSFVNDRDRIRVESVRNASKEGLADFHPNFSDERLPGLLLHYKARSYPGSLSESEMNSWEEWRVARLQGSLPAFQGKLTELSAKATDDQQFLLQELQLWAESILPIG